ncbi:MAG: HypC/HybG/HupF family hydrogenase formation chaperone [Candidatus Omnitrophica bacterium]|nr:HypC/HybG/HupF family hydrogenase formation chaperone [Candidatus Omnitrophota bacterium]
MCLAVPGRVESIRGEDPLTRSAKVSFGGALKEVNLAFVPEAEVGDYVLVHVGCALVRIDPDEAERLFQLLEELEDPAPEAKA